MQNPRALLISLIVALVAVLMVYSYISKREEALMELATPITVVVAAKDIPQGARLDESMLKAVEIPKKYVQPGTVGEVTQVADRVVLVPVLQETQILESMFRTTRETGIAGKVNKGKRAFAIAVSDVTAVADLVQPGDFVDLLVTVETGSFKEGQTVSEEVLTKTFMQNVLVLAVNKLSSAADRLSVAPVQQEAGGSMFTQVPSNQSGRDALKTLTLELAPADIQKVNLAQEIGSISVALRSRFDEGQAVTLDPLNAQKFLGITKPIVPRRMPAWVEIRGSEQILR